MGTPPKGLVHCNTITLDAPVPPLEGKQVFVVLEAVDEPRLSTQEQAAAWANWIAKGPQGPIESDGESEFL